MPKSLPFTFAVVFAFASFSLGLESAQTFTLRHVHSTHVNSGRIRWSDVPNVPAHMDISLLSNSALANLSPRTHTLQTKKMKVHQPTSQAAFQTLRTNSRKRKRGNSRSGLLDDWEQSLSWEEHDVEGPATDKRETLLALAKMTSNAYYNKGSIGWYDLGKNWTSVSVFIG